MKIFVSHASEQAETAASVALSLRGDGHDVFLGRSSLPPGDTYDDEIRAAIAASDFVVFLVSPAAVSSGRYTLTELELVESKWPHPAGHVLPVVVEPTDLRAIPSYLKAVTLLQPRGNVTAAVAAAVARATRGRRGLARRAVIPLAVLGLAVLGLASWWIYEDRQARRATASLIAAARIHEEAGNYVAAWEQYARAMEIRPDDPSLVADRQELAMSWLDNVKVTTGQDTFTGVVERVQDVLVACAASADRVRAADCRAHLGWAEFLRWRDGRHDADPVAHYRQALERDSGNVYAHAMWGFDILRGRGSLAAAQAHFDRALASRRAGRFVRRLQVAGLLWRRDAEAEEALVRVANDIRLEPDRTAGEAVLEEDRWRLWNVYYSRLVNRHDIEPFLAALPAADHLATFDAVFPASEVPPDKRLVHEFMLGTLQERAGDARALATFQSLHAALAREGALAWGGRVPEGTEAALRRLGATPAQRAGSRR